MQNDRQSSETVSLGVDTHLDIHVGAVISQAGKLPGTHIIKTNQAGYLELLDWACSFGILERAGIEGTGTSPSLKAFGSRKRNWLTSSVIARVYSSMYWDGGIDDNLAISENDEARCHAPPRAR